MPPSSRERSPKNQERKLLPLTSALTIDKAQSCAVNGEEMFVHSRIISNVRQTDVDLEVGGNRVTTGVHAKMDYMQNVCPGTG